MIKSWKCVHASGYIWIIKTDSEKGTLTIFDENGKTVHEEKNASKMTLKAVEKFYMNPDVKPEDTKDAMMYI